MKKIISTILMAVAVATQAVAQDATVQNRPYTDLRPFHFGVLVGAHMQDLEFNNIGPQVITNDDGTTVEKIITCDQDRWDSGINVGVLGELRLNQTFALRVAPAMYFGTRHLTFNNLTDKMADGKPVTQTQDLKSVYISCAAELLFAAPRFNNHRPYLMAGINPMINLTSRDDDYIKLKRYDVFLEVGLGCDLYLPFFKLRPELKFCYGLTNSLDLNHGKNIRDKNKLMYTNSVDKAQSKMIVLTFYFE